jgi:hypothetical protein
MIATVAAWRDRLLGRGEHAITVPVLDGGLKSNAILDEATLVNRFNNPWDLVSDGKHLFVADGRRVVRLLPAGDSMTVQLIREFREPVTALAAIGPAELAVVLGGREVRLLGSSGTCSESLLDPSERLTSINALSPDGGARLLATEGSSEHPPWEWKRDLMSRGATGSALEIDLDGRSVLRRSSGLAHPFGCARVGGMRWVSESWRHRLVALHDGADEPATVLSNLPCYPSRLVEASGGGAWVSAFAMRTQLVEFVLREHRFRERMMAEIDSRWWIAPSLSSGRSFMEPMQGAHLRTMGVIKPWAPPRSYGLVIRIDAQGNILGSLHSRFDGQHHGIVAVAELGQTLYVLSAGSGYLLSLNAPLAGATP